MAYVYRHIRLDKNVPFYIGIGSDNNGKHERAYSNKNRNKHWLNISSKTEYEVEIILDNISWETACKKEIEFIKLYGRRQLKSGTLVNLTNGGEGILGFKMPQEIIDKVTLITGKPVARYNEDGEFIDFFKSCMEAERKLGISNTSICACANLKGRTLRAGGFSWRWYHGNAGKVAIKNDYLVKKKIKVYDYYGIFLSKHNSVKEAAILYNIDSKGICNVLRCKCMSYKKYIFKYDLDGSCENIVPPDYYEKRRGSKNHFYGRRG